MLVKMVKIRILDKASNMQASTRKKKDPQLGKTVLWKQQYLYIEMMLSSIPNTDFLPVIAVLYVSVTTVVIVRQTFSISTLFLNLIQTEWRGKVLSRAII